MKEQAEEWLEKVIFEPKVSYVQGRQEEIGWGLKFLAENPLQGGSWVYVLVIGIIEC